MSNFGNKKRGGSAFGNRRHQGGGRSRFGGAERGRGRAEMHQAICADCGNQCQVPFRPTGDKPVYCSDCFGGRGRPAENKGGSFGRNFGNDRKMHQAVCAECGDRCEVPFKPTGDKPVLCSHCFEGRSPKAQMFGTSEESGRKYDEILLKLDKILSLLRRTNPVKEVTIMKADPEKDTSSDQAEVKVEEKKKTAKKISKKTSSKKATVSKTSKTSKKKSPATKKKVLKKK